jgi:MFS family permease
MLIGAASGVAVALGPLIGGYLTTYYSWRYVFAAETLVMIGVLFYTLTMADTKPTSKVRIDARSVLLSASGMTIMVYGILQSKAWGWVAPKGAPEINGIEITPLGISVVAYFIVFGLYILYRFYKRQLMLEKAKKNPLLSVSMLSIKPLRAGLAVLSGQYIITAATFFVIPIYLQMVLGYDALETGKRIFPLSVSLVIFSVIGSRLIVKYNPKQIIRMGQWSLILGALILTGAINPEMKGFLFGAALFIVGAGLGLLASQIGNVTMSSVSQDKSSEVGGLQGAFQNLGASLGTAIIGSVMIASLTTGFVDTINANPNISENVKTTIEEKSTSGIPIASDKEVEEYALQAGLPSSEAEALAADYKESQIQSLRAAMFFLVLVALFTLTFSRNIPTKKVA